MKKIRFIIFLIFIFQGLSLYSQSRSTIVIDTPTAYTIGKGVYKISFLGYDNGGMELKTVLGLHENLYLGVSFDVQNAIGKDTPSMNVPGVIARIMITEGAPPFPPAIAIGWDSFYYGSEGRTYNTVNSFNRMINGLYLAFTSPIYLFDSEQFISYGVRLPVLPYYMPDDTSYFFGLDIPLGSSFRIKGEVERVYWNLKRYEDWMYNAGVRYTYLEQLGIEVDFMFQTDENPNRIIRIEYIDEF